MTGIVDKYQGIVPNRIINAVASAAKRTGMDFSFLMEKAAAESNFKPEARAKTSSATGLFQFIDSTWLNMVKEHGAKYGLGKLAEKIEMKNGRACVSDCAAREEILALRKNPEIASLMAGEFSAENKRYLEQRTQGDVGATELYLAHFLGAGAATKFINSRDVNGQAVAADLFPKEAAANRNVFFDSKTGKARSLDEVYARFAAKFDSDGKGMPMPAQAPPAPVQVASVDATSARFAQALFSFDAPAAILPFSMENLLIMAQMQQLDADPVRRDPYGRA